MIYSFSNNISDLEIGVDNISGMKKPCLVYKEGNREVKLASFNNEEASNLFIEKMVQFLGMEYESSGELTQ